MASKSPEITSAFQETQLEVDGLNIRAFGAGQGDPVVVLDTLSFGLTSVHLALAQAFRVVVLQLPGFGAGASGETSQSVKDLAGTMSKAAVLSGVVGNDPTGAGKYSLVGTSFAANVALWQTIQAQEQVEALVLISPTIIRPTGLVPSGDREQMGRSLLAHPDNQENLARIDVAATARENELAHRLLGGGTSPVLSQETEDRLGEIQCPTLVVFGLHDKLAATEAGSVLREKIPNSHLSFIYDAGHAIALERPESLAGLVVDYVTRQETFIVSQDDGVINP
jgi:pimeloyl-ACP methyl ester carboxylesterase